MANRVTDDYGTVAGGIGNQAGDNAGTTSDRPYATVGGGELNTASGNYATVGGGFWNTANEGFGTVGGGVLNGAISGYATVGGGAQNGASGRSATVGGGETNRATDYYGTIGGGHMNTAGVDDGDETNQKGATVGGGDHNIASGNYATVPGGYYNTTTGDYGTALGGYDNDASGSYATVGGGYWNIASGDYSFAAGSRARADNQGCFVWGDSTDADVACNDNDRFIARASGGVHLYTNSSLTSGAYLASGSGTWSSVSDRDLKENFSSVDGQEVVAALAEIPMTTWNYTTEDSSVRHMGPTAQDLYTAFGLGDDERYITTIDADGVALAAVQGLYELSQEQEARIDTLEARVTALEGGAPLERGSESLLSSMMPGGWLLLAGLFVVGGLVVVQRRLRGVGR